MLEPQSRGPSMVRAASAAAMVASMLATPGCEDDIYRVAAQPWSPTSGAGGQSIGGGGPGGSATGGTGGAGGAGSSLECLDASFYDDALTLGQAGLCVVGRYTAAMEVGYALSPTWGLHGGPLTGTYQHLPDSEATISRWLVPEEPLGTLAAQTMRVPLDIAAETVFFGAQVVDVPFYWWTVVSWTGPFGSHEGETIVLLDDIVEERHPTVGMYGAVGLGRPFEPGRILHSSLTAMGDATAPQEPGIYAADYCMGPPPIACGRRRVAAWGEANGPLAVDDQGNAFALQTWFSTGLQSLRGFEATTLSPHAPASEGNELLTMPGFGSELAAMGPTSEHPGLVLFQPYDSASLAALDVIALPYEVSHTTLAPAGEVTVAFSLVTPGTPVSLMTDLEGRAWVGMVTSEGVTTFYVLDRRGGSDP